ncbi:Rha family transcriptional regulator [Burkholderia sp. FERM BP-3421]|uniref:Rha family transcriptional regulator n=1 Tax=Burkholderia sp. FERM BP-3421 TaxID=1494466 RepID=UPI00235E6261|nr:Rha family transcriptional regulator [Burkholderia sp. FERM BP-3421]WDD94862.1 Rha family transcriptional regulator [Burkholderia sp. FERM BP-3421]
MAEIGRGAAPLAAALVKVHGGKLITDSLKIAREFGRNHKNVLRTIDSLIADGTIDRLNFEPTSYTDKWNRRQRMIELDERGALIAMPFVGGRNARIGQSRLVDAFLAMRAVQAEKATSDWSENRQVSAAHYGVVCEMLAMRRDAEGKETRPHHYVNEARLLAFALTGEFKSLDRESLSAADQRILKRLEMRATALIGMGRSYDERKAALIAFAAELRASGAGSINHKTNGGAQ